MGPDIMLLENILQQQHYLHHTYSTIYIRLHVMENVLSKFSYSLKISEILWDQNVGQYQTQIHWSNKTPVPTSPYTVPLLHKNNINILNKEKFLIKRTAVPPVHVTTHTCTCNICKTIIDIFKVSDTGSYRQDKTRSTAKV